MDDNLKISERDKALFDKIAARYARKDIIESSSLARRYQVVWAVGPVLKKLGSNITICELGCGVAAPAKYLAGRYSRYIGVDYSSEMIQAAQAYNQNNEHFEATAQDVTAFSLPQHSVDVVLAVGVLHHIPNVKKALESVRQIGKPGGYLVAIEPQRANPFIQLARWLRSRLDKSYSSEQHFFTKGELVRFLEAAGFQNISIEYQGFFSKPFGQIVLPLQFIFAPLSKLAVSIDKFLDNYLPGPLRFLSWDLVVRAQFPLKSRA